ncbi:hypothetical protein [Streptomyces sp. NBC_01236]|uniref:hypothetical protein n=1 Tax=Streptomyces sp. NBC_01236 TaxID=2903789 RepID=UPI002E11B854|nr:hypothetical protein OG324_39325 [Streptomyces sp. NBC_01236]
MTGRSYLSLLSLDPDSTVTAPSGGTVAMTVDGAQAPVEPGRTYTGSITPTPA